MDAKLKKQLDLIPPDAFYEYVASLPRTHIYSARLDAHHSVSLNSFLSESCSKTDLIVLSGSATTGSSGTKKILIDPHLCGVMSEGLKGQADDPDFELPEGTILIMVGEPNCVATAKSSTPVFITVQTREASVGPSLDGYFPSDRGGNSPTRNVTSGVELHITSWKHDGNPAPGITFAWICTIEAVRIRTLEG